LAAARLSRRQRFNLRIKAERRRLEAARGTSPTVGFAFDAFSYDNDTGAPVLAAALGFRVFLFQVPYVCLLVIIAGFVADMTGRSVESMFRGKGIASLTARSVQNAASLSGWARLTSLILVAYALFLTARAFVKVLNIVHSLVWDVPRTKLRSLNRATFGFVGFVTFALALSYLIQALRDRTSIGGVAALILFTIVPFLAWWYVSWWLPHGDCPPITLAPGAALFAIGIEILHVVTVVWFPHHLHSKSEIYGTIGLSVALLLWAYLIGRLITLAAVLNAALWTRFGAHSPHPIQLQQPSWRVPLIDDKLGRLWTLIFGDDNRDNPDPPNSPPTPGH
jgi:membrane protein